MNNNYVLECLMIFFMCNSGSMHTRGNKRRWKYNGCSRFDVSAATTGSAPILQYFGLSSAMGSFIVVKMLKVNSLIHYYTFQFVFRQPWMFLIFFLFPYFLTIYYRACGGGIKERKVECKQIMAQEHKVERRDELCPSLKPVAQKPCNTKPCEPEDQHPSIASSNTTYIQHDPKKTKVTLKIGGAATVFLGTQIKIKCPIKR